MAHIIPFRGTLYDQATVGSIRDVVAPPYDIIDAAGQQALHDRHAHNIIRLELGTDKPGDSAADNRYTRAAATLRDWLKTGAMKRDAQPALYYHTIEYRPPDSAADAPGRVLRGFLVTTKLEPLDSGHIYPHENTRAAAKTDRLNLLEACRANLSPIWLLYSDPQNAVLGLLEDAVKGVPARIDFRDDAGCRQQLWAVTDPSVLRQIVEVMASKPLFIADGHHRYETALNYQRARRQQARGASSGLHPYDSVLMLLAPLEDPGLTVLPTHRVTTTPLPPYEHLKGLLSEKFAVKEFPFTSNNRTAVRAQFIESLRHLGRTAPTFGLSVRGLPSFVTLTLLPAHRPGADASPRTKLDVSLLQQLVVPVLCPTQQEQEAIVYTKDEAEAMAWAQEGPGTAALLLNATKVSEVQAVAVAGERMPHKSTYFYPKPLTGLVINVMEG
ncbi:MAG: DUF1015 family protein [Nitrospira sp.]|nr:DUF1015 family protein [Nitrospira sp.]